VVFSGDLGAPYTPLLPAPQPPASADVVVMESTYGDNVHEGRKTRRQRLQALCEHAFGNGGVLLVPAFSIGRTQELLYELEEIIHRNRQRPAASGVAWGDVQVVVDSPLAADFTAGYAQLKAHWDAEARAKLAAGRHPLDFAQLTTVDDHAAHLRMVAALARSARPAIVIAASGRTLEMRQRRAHRQLPEGHAGRCAARRAVLRLPGGRHAGARHPGLWPARRVC
jgi:metallo-beta-lactamase family protein